jgi:hypothetical protein
MYVDINIIIVPMRLIVITCIVDKLFSKNRYNKNIMANMAYFNILIYFILYYIVIYYVYNICFFLYIKDYMIHLYYLYDKHSNIIAEFNDVFDLIIHVISNKLWDHMIDLKYKVITTHVFSSFHINDKFDIVFNDRNVRLAVLTYINNPHEYLFYDEISTSNRYLQKQIIMYLCKTPASNQIHTEPELRIDQLLTEEPDTEPNQTTPNPNHTKPNDDLFCPDTEISEYNKFRAAENINVKLDKKKELYVYEAYIGMTYATMLPDIKDKKYNLANAMSINEDFKHRWLIITFLNLYNLNTFDNYIFLLDQEVSTIPDVLDDVDINLLEMFELYENQKNKIMSLINNDNLSWLNKSEYDAHVFD